MYLKRISAQKRVIDMQGRSMEHKYIRGGKWQGKSTKFSFLIWDGKELCNTLYHLFYCYTLQCCFALKVKVTKVECNCTNHPLQSHLHCASSILSCSYSSGLLSVPQA
jgi:hypothetical protein